jgi:hypothetical protein
MRSCVFCFSAWHSLVGLAVVPPLVSAITATLIASATLEERADVDRDGIEFGTEGPVDVTVQEVTFAPGEAVDWHDHPGFALIAVRSGTMTFYLGCKKVVRGPGAADIETGSPTKLRRSTRGARRRSSRSPTWFPRARRGRCPRLPRAASRGATRATLATTTSRTAWAIGRPHQRPSRPPVHRRIGSARGRN